MNNLDLVLKKNKYNQINPQTEVCVGGSVFGKEFTVIAGPCAVESEEQLMITAEGVKKAGATILRGGVYKPRTSPYAFQGLGERGLEYLRKVGEIHDLPIITEVVDTRAVALMAESVDILQIGARNMQNYSLLQEVGKTKKPVLLKRGMNATIAEWLNAAEYILKAGNPNVILCERGIRTFENYTRNTLDLSAVAVVKNLSHLPVIVDPSHAAGRADLIAPLSLAALMVGADGLIIEVHPEPTKALSDAEQQLTISEFDSLMQQIKAANNCYQKFKALDASDYA